MKARRAPLNDAVFGSLYIFAGVVVSIISFGQEQSFDTFALVFAALTFGAAILLVAFCGRQLRRAQTFTESVALLPWYSVAARATLSTAVPLAGVVFVSILSGRFAWILGTELLILGTGMCGIAAFAARIERRSKGRVLKADNRYFLAQRIQAHAV